MQTTPNISNFARSNFDCEIAGIGREIDEVFSESGHGFAYFDVHLRNLAHRVLQQQAEVARDELFGTSTETIDIIPDPLTIKARIDSLGRNLNQLLTESIPSTEHFTKNAYLYMRMLSISVAKCVSGFGLGYFCAGYFERVSFQFSQADSWIAAGGFALGASLMIWGFMGLLDRLQAPFVEGRILPLKFQLPDVVKWGTPTRAAAMLRTEAGDRSLEANTGFNLTNAFFTEPDREFALYQEHTLAERIWRKIFQK